jgi:hypothetical protein
MPDPDSPYVYYKSIGDYPLDAGKRFVLLMTNGKQTHRPSVLRKVPLG